MLVRNFNLMDIKRYEDETGNNILAFFNSIKFEYILDLIRLGNGNCSIERAADILDNYLTNENKTLLDAILEIKDKLIGIGDNETDETEEEDKIDITQYSSLTDLYINFSMQLMSVGLTYNEFWSMTTKEMYKVFNSINIKMINETNRELSNYHMLAGMVGGAVWGKLSKEPPKLDMKHNNKDKNLDLEDVITIANLKSLVNRHNKKENEKGEI